MDETFDRLTKAAQVMTELFPFLLYRLGIYAAFGAVLMGYWTAVLVGFWIVSKISESMAGLIIVAALFVHFGILWLARDYLLYLVKAGYVAVLTQVVTMGALPAGMTQTEFAKQAVSNRFKEVSGMAAVDALIRGVVKSFNSSLEEFASWIPIPGLDQVVALIRGVVSIATNSIDEAILSLTFTRKDQSVWEAAKDGLILYVQNWKPILKIAVAVTLVDWVCTFVAFVMLTLGCSFFALAFFGWFPFAQKVIFVSPLVAAYVVRLALIEPLAVTAVLITYHRCIKGQRVDPSWDEKLSALSSHFKELKEKALQAPPVAPQPAKA